MTTTEVAHLLHVQTATVRRWIATGQLPAIHVGPRRLVRLAAKDVDRLLAGEVVA